MAQNVNKETWTRSKSNGGDWAENNVRETKGEKETIISFEGVLQPSRIARDNARKSKPLQPAILLSWVPIQWKHSFRKANSQRQRL